MLNITPLQPLFAARIEGVDVARGIDGATMAALRDALDRYAVLVLPGQMIDDPAQIAFSQGFGALEMTRPGALGAGSAVIVLSTIGPGGEIAAPSDKQLLNNKANSAREIPSAGGNTEFAFMRGAFAALDAAEQARLRGMVALHDFGWSRGRVDPTLVTDAERTQHPAVRQAVVLEENPYGPALYLGAHARSIDGMTEAESRALIDRLMAHATGDRFIYSHRWSPGDLLIWDNRAVLHRATPFASTTERRHMVRTTVAGQGPTIAAAA